MKTQVLLKLLSLLFIIHFSFFIAHGQPCTPNPSSVAFDGISSCVRINTLNGLELTNALTIEAWIYPTAFASSPTGGSILCKHAWGSSVYGFVLRCGGNGQLSFNLAGAVNSVPVGWEEALSNPGALTLNTWQHVAASFDGTMLQLYINGSPAGNYPFVGTINPSTGYKARIGALADTVWGMSRYFTGNIDEVRIWDHALSPTEIVSGMNDHIDPALQTGLVGYYRLNENSGILIHDLGTGNNEGTMLNGNWSSSVPFNNNSLPAPTITWQAPNLVSSYASGNQWYLGLQLLAGATQQTYHPTQYGNYKVVVTDTNGCTSVSLPFNYNTTGMNNNSANMFSLQPNPARDKVSIFLPDNLESADCYLFSVTGELMEKLVVTRNNSLLNLDHLSPGLYVVKVLGGGLIYIDKLLIIN